ncbi:MAG: hypothetical protein M3P11_04590 [Actinomycetota bacterium]|nr:hypothetical protein [Actinomycetota bacterium]
MRRSARILLATCLVASLLGIAAPARGGVVYTLSVIEGGSGGGSVTSSPAGIDCGSTCSWDFLSGTVVTLTAAARADSRLTGWTGGGCSGTGTCQVTMNAPITVGAEFTLSYRPDAWIKLCGAGDRCAHPRRHHYRGEDVFNTTGARQTVSAGVEEANDIRFWIKLENDGALGDRFFVQGCSGNSSFVIRAVLVGAHTGPSNATHITKAFKHGTAHFDFPPSTTTLNVVLTLDMIAATSVEGVSYTCRITVSSKADPTVKDTVKAKMTTV